MNTIDIKHEQNANVTSLRFEKCSHCVDTLTDKKTDTNRYVDRLDSCPCSGSTNLLHILSKVCVSSTLTIFLKV